MPWPPPMETLTEEDFYAPAHQVIFSAMAQLYRSAQPIDLVTLVDVLEQRNEVTKAGGMEYICPAFPNGAHHHPISAAMWHCGGSVSSAQHHQGRL